MLKYIAVLKDGGEKPLNNVLTAALDMDMRVPADSLTLTVPFDNTLRKNADAIAVYDGGGLVFRGQLDNIVTVKRGQGLYMKLNARSAAAALLDNEAEPVTYYSPNENLIYEKHLRPFGLKLEKTGDSPYFDKLMINKGMSHWQVLKSFCMNRYGTEPRVSADGTVRLKGAAADKSVVFSDTEGEAVYFMLKESNRRHRIISEVKLKFRNLNTYSSSILNRSGTAEGIKRVRYINAASDKTTVATAEKILENGNRDSYALNLSCIGCLADVFGCDAVVEDSVLGKIENLCVRKVKYILDGSGELSELLLERKDF